MDPRLLITNIGYTLATIFTFGIGIFVYAKNTKRFLNVLFLLMNLAVVVFEVSHVIGINVLDHDLSRKIFMFNLTNIFIVIFIAHWILEITGRVHRRIIPLSIIYLSGLTLFVFFLFHPETFLIDSIPKMYLPNYYEPGKYYWIMRMYFNLVGLYFFYELISAYRESVDYIERNRLKYIFWGLVFGLIVGSSALFLVFNIEIDPIWSMFFGLYTLAWAYAILKYDLMDIRIVAGKALLYALLVGSLSLCISVLSFSNQWILSIVPGFPFWLLPVLSSVIAVWIGVFVWKRTKENDLLKYEFMTIITHKFRTPLTQIKWLLNLLEGQAIDKVEQNEITALKRSTSSLVELTNMLVSLSDTETKGEQYIFEKISLPDFVKPIIKEYQTSYPQKNIELHTNEENLTALFDKTKLGFVIQTLLDNAIAYTSPQGRIIISFMRAGRNIICEVKDNGIGITKEEVPYVFSKFYRATAAKHADTEGMGIGLFMAQTIIKRHNGIISASSPGLGEGATFSFTLPAA